MTMPPTADTPDGPRRPADPGRHARFTAILRDAGLIPSTALPRTDPAQEHALARAMLAGDTEAVGVLLAEMPGLLDQPGLGWLRCAVLERARQERLLLRELRACLGQLGRLPPEWLGRSQPVELPEDPADRAAWAVLLDGIADGLPEDLTVGLDGHPVSQDERDGRLGDGAEEQAELAWGAGQAALLLAQLAAPQAGRSDRLIRRCEAWRTRVASTGRLLGDDARVQAGIVTCDRLLASLRLHALFGLDAPLRGDDRGEPLPRDAGPRG